MRRKAQPKPHKRRFWRHLTMTDRLNIEKWLGEGMKAPEIARLLGVSRQTVWREIRRGQYERLDSATWEMKQAYSPDIADEKYRENLRAKGPQIKIGNDFEYARWIEKTIMEKDCSPGALIGYARQEGKTFQNWVTPNTIYSYVRKGVFLHLRMEDLPRRGKHKAKYQRLEKEKISRAPAGESIEKRPEEVDSREAFGHWEGDTIYSAKNTGKAALLTLTERKTRKEFIIKVKNRKAETIVHALDRLEKKMGAKKFRAIFKSITVDNGTEFADTEGMEGSYINKKTQRTKLYYCHPYSSFERGTNENQNGMARRKHPKGTDFSKVTTRQIAETEAWMNDYPRPMFGYRSSNELFAEELARLGIAM